MNGSRLDEVRQALVSSNEAGRSTDAFIVTNLTNIRYLVGFSGSNGLLTLDGESATLVTDGRYELQARSEVAAAGEPVDVQIVSGSLADAVSGLVPADATIGFESAHVSHAEHRRLTDGLAPRSLVPHVGVVETLRSTKAPEELELMRRAAGLADDALAHVRPTIAPGLTERDLAIELESTVRRLGANRPAFETIVASGPNAAKPHHRPGDRALEVGDLVIVDFGAEFGGYRSDMTRSFSLGAPDGRRAEMLEAVRHAQQAGVDAVGPDVPIASVDEACRASLRDAGLAEYFTHGTGHGVGLDIHEAPWVNGRATGILAPGHVITVEPGVYIPDVGGVRWEDTVVVTASGAESLTRSEKQPVIT